MEKEFNLSEKMFYNDISGLVCHDIDIKEFIRLLKKLGFARFYNMKVKEWFFTISIDKLDKLAGDKFE